MAVMSGIVTEVCLAYPVVTALKDDLDVVELRRADFRGNSDGAG